MFISMKNIGRKFVSKLRFEPQISGFTHRLLNQLVHRVAYYIPTQKQISLSYSYFNPRLSECNTILQFLLESNTQVGILFGILYNILTSPI